MTLIEKKWNAKEFCLNVAGVKHKHESQTEIRQVARITDPMEIPPNHHAMAVILGNF